MFQEWTESIAATKPYQVCPGNHDVTCNILSDLPCDKGQRNFSAFRHRFRMPSQESGASNTSHFNMWYSFDFGSVHFVSISTESDFEGAPTTPSSIIGGKGGGFGDQVSWIKKDL